MDVQESPMYKDKCLGTFNYERIVISATEILCYAVTKDEIKEIPELSSTQEQADTKIILQTNHYLETTSSNVSMHSPSGDTEIIVLAVSLLRDALGEETHQNNLWPQIGEETSSPG